MAHIVHTDAHIYQRIAIIWLANVVPIFAFQSIINARTLNFDSQWQLGDAVSTKTKQISNKLSYNYIVLTQLIMFWHIVSRFWESFHRKGKAENCESIVGFHDS